MPLFVWAAFALAALLIAGSAASNMGTVHTIALPGAGGAALANQPGLPWFLWLLLGAGIAVAAWRCWPKLLRWWRK